MLSSLPGGEGLRKFICFTQACQLGYGPKVGDELVKRLLAEDEAFS